METKQKTTLTQGSVARGMLLFALPIFISNLFQQLYNAADSLIVGNFLGGEALAAVGSSADHRQPDTGHQAQRHGGVDRAAHSVPVLGAEIPRDHDARAQRYTVDKAGQQKNQAA